jgi:hypothetical protein
VGDHEHETAGEVFADALRRWREAIAHDPDATPSEPAPEDDRVNGSERSDADEPGPD